VSNVVSYVVENCIQEVLQCKLCLYSEFYGAVESSTPDIRNLLQIPLLNTGDVPDSEKMTIFAPINRAFRKNDFDQNLNVNREVSVSFMMQPVSELRLVCSLMALLLNHRWNWLIA
jgi:hypothetical protein